MKKNIKVIMLVLIGIIIGVTVGGIGVYATLTYSASDIAYTKSGSSTPISVSSALNELYQNKKDTTDDTKNITANGSITLEKYYKNLNVNVPIPAGYIVPSGTKTITTKANNIDVSNFKYADTSDMYTAAEYAAKTGEGEYWKKKSCTAPTNGSALDINCGFRPSFVFIKYKGSFSQYSAYSIYPFSKWYGGDTSNNSMYDWTQYYTVTDTGITHTFAQSWYGVSFDVYFFK